MLDWMAFHPLYTIALIVLCAIIESGLAVIVLRHVYPDQKAKVAFFFFVFGLVMPFIGVIATILLTLLIKMRNLKEQNLNIEKIDLEPLHLIFARTRRIFGEGAMSVVFQNKNTPVNLKIRALDSLQKEPNRYRLHIIKQALSDTQDEVRLFSFSIIDKFEKRINAKIHEALERFKTEESEDIRLTSAKELANYYWDMVYFELSDPVLQNFFINQAKYYNEYALEHDMDDMNMHILAGKIALKEEEFQKAQQEFALVLESDTRRYDFVAPYLAEIFYREQNYITTKSLMATGRHLRFNQQLYPLVALWTEQK